jgi:hypothetical protein
MSAAMPDGEALGELERRLSDAKEPDRSIDREIAQALGFKVEVFKVPHGHPIFKEGGGLEFMEQDGQRTTIPPYTSSVDAALALVSRTLEPLGFVSWGIDGTLTGYVSAWVVVNKPVGLIQGYAPIQQTTPALAMCLALVRALKAKVTTDAKIRPQDP